MPQSTRNIGLSQLRVGLLVLIAIAVLILLILNASGTLNPFASHIHLRARFAVKLPRVVTGSVIATLSDDPYLIPEGVAYDTTRDTLYVGSIARRAIFRLCKPRRTRSSSPGWRLR